LAAKAAVNSPLLDMAIDGAKGVLFNITGGKDLGMFEIDEAAKVITKNVDPDAKVKFGAVIDDSMGDELRITVIATGFDEHNRRPASSMTFSQPEEAPKPVAAPPVSVPEPPRPEDEDQQVHTINWRLLLVAGLIAGFGFAIKPTAILAILMALSVMAGATLGGFGFAGMAIAGFGILQFFGALSITGVLERAGMTASTSSSIISGIFFVIAALLIGWE
jgi:hypothetical protein